MDWRITGSQKVQNRKIQKKSSLEYEQAKNLCVQIGKIYKESNNNTEQNESRKVDAYITHISSNILIPRRYFGDISKLTN